MSLSRCERMLGGIPGRLCWKSWNRRGPGSMSRTSRRVERSLDLVGDRWTLLLVRDMLPGPRRFQDFQQSLPGIPPNILSHRLKLMEEHALVTRRFYSDHPPRAEYELTDKGKELGVVVGALAAWGARHVYRRARLVHADSGREVRLGYFRADTGERVPGSSIRLSRGSSGT